MPKRWHIRPHDPQLVAALERSARVPAVVAQLLVCRGILNPQRALQFLDPKLADLRPPAELPGAEAAAALLLAAARDKRRIVVYGDYDVDGMSGAATLYQCLRLLDADVRYFIPHRLNDGYGLNHNALKQLATDGAQTVVTVDCGIASVAEARTARQLGLQLLVTDHHEMAEALPEADAIVHPGLVAPQATPTGLCGSGVAFKVAWSLCQQACSSERVTPRLRNFLLDALVLAMLGTVADVVPLVDENRIVVRHGLLALKQRPSLGLATLLKVAELDQSAYYSAEDVGFGIAPRLNAAGRLGQARLAVELLTTASPERALELARYIDGLNDTRKTLERSIYLAAKKQASEAFDPVGDAALVLSGRGWHAGVIGIVAGRLAEKYHRPVVLISRDELGVKPAVGSARSVPGFNLYEALCACGEHLQGYGGHAAAAGLKIDEGAIEAFRADFCEHAAREIAPEERHAELHIDAEAPLSAFTLKAVDQMERLAPFGAGNARPLLAATGVELAGEPRTMGGGDRHLSMKLRQHGVNLRCVAFGGGEWADDLKRVDGPLAVAFHPKINVYAGRRSVELELADWKPAE